MWAASFNATSIYEKIVLGPPLTSALLLKFVDLRPSRAGDMSNCYVKKACDTDVTINM